MKKHKPTSPSRRSMTHVDYGLLTTSKPAKQLIKKIKSRSGRNNQGRITVRHQGGGHKKMYRDVDFRQLKLNIPAKVEHVEYDPYRTAFIARIVYADGARSYILAHKDTKVGDTIITKENASPISGNRVALKNVPVGYFVHNVEITKGKGGQLVRSAGAYAEVLAHENGYANIKLPSGEIRIIPWDNFATVGQTSNIDHNLVSIGKAGRSRWLGIRPTVRGTAMNPVDHPYGGGEGRQPRGTRKPKTKWGKVTGGRKTRNKKKWSNKFILKRRK